jgi:hypothetical protein
LRGDGHTDFICDHEATAPFEAFLGKKYLNVTK